MYELPHSEACERNKGPIFNALMDVFPAEGCILEIGSCTGQHVVFFASAIAGLTWQPTDRLEYLGGLNARVQQQGTAAILKPLELDVLGAWPDRLYDGVYSANTAHIMSWPAVVAMFTGVGSALKPGGVFCLYGPFRESEGHTANSNEVFDHSLRMRDPAMGVRELHAIEKLAESAQMRLLEKRSMPANNLLLVFKRNDGNLDD
jgi:hypothetical protein